MKYPIGRLLAAALIWLGTVGCGHVDLTPEGDPNRSVNGTVNVRMNLLPPPDSEVVVRLAEPPDVTAAPTLAANDLVIGERGTRENPERVVAEQVIRAPAGFPVSFHLEFKASDDRLRRGLNLEARMSWGGRVRFRNAEAQALTLGTATSAQVIWLEPVR